MGNDDNWQRKFVGLKVIPATLNHAVMSWLVISESPRKKKGSDPNL